MNANTNVENPSLEIEVAALRKQVETQKQLIQLLQNKKMIQIHTQLREHEKFQEENVRLREQVESQKQLKHLLQNKRVSQIQPQLRESNEKFQEEMNEMARQLENHKWMIQKQRELIEIQQKDYSVSRAEPPLSVQNKQVSCCDIDEELEALREHPDRPKSVRDRCEELEKRVENIREVTYQLLGGLFHQGKQERCLRRHINQLFYGKYDEEKREGLDIQEESTWPTTRQGDELQERMESLEIELNQHYYHISGLQEREEEYSKKSETDANIRTLFRRLDAQNERLENHITELQEREEEYSKKSETDASIRPLFRRLNELNERLDDHITELQEEYPKRSEMNANVGNVGPFYTLLDELNARLKTVENRCALYEKRAASLDSFQTNVCKTIVEHLKHLAPDHV
uniref:Uncharacterized protein n=1 Tax=viral metagenome TaxID=1070528 RepID=A0A6C0DYS7_9ZZZZ